MLAVTILDNVSGLRAKHFRNTKHALQKVELPERAYLLDDNFIILQKNWSKVILLSRQRIKKADGNDAVLTWIGVYVASPHQYDKREGLYCGAGLWLLDTVASGEAVLSFLERELDRLYSSMEEKRIPSEWRVEDAELSDIGIGREELHQVISSEKPLNAARGISADRNMGTCFLGSASSETLGASIAKAQEGVGFSRFSKIFITDDLHIVDDLRRRGRATECDKIAGGNVSLIQEDGINNNQELLDIDVVRSLRKEVKMLRGIIGDTAGGVERQLREMKKLVIILLILSVGIVFETARAFIPTILGVPAVHGIVKPFDHASPSVELSSTQTPPVVLAEPSVQLGGSRASGCLDVSTAGAAVTKDQPSRVENPSTEVPTSPNSKEIECLARDLEELTSLIDRILPTLPRNAALKMPAEQAHEGARKPLEASKPK